MCYKNKKNNHDRLSRERFYSRQQTRCFTDYSFISRILASIFSCFSQKVALQLQPALEEMNVEEPTDQDLSPGGIPSL